MQLACCLPWYAAFEEGGIPGKAAKNLHRLPGGFKWLQRNNRKKVVAYFETMADWMEKKMTQHIVIDHAELVPIT